MSVLFKGKNGNELEMGFTRESYAEVQDGSGDSGWTTVNFRVATREEAWEEIAPVLNIYEFARLAEWLESVGSGERAEGGLSEVELLEPELKFSLVGQSDDDVTIRVGFHLPARPEEFRVDAETEELDYVDLHMGRDTVLGAAEALRATLSGLALAPLKDDTTAAEDTGLMGESDTNLNIVDRIEREPPGAGEGEDNAGET
jgi:hypothetical protein